MKKFISLLLTMVSVFAAFALTACSCGSNEDGGENVIQINYWKAGLGDEFFKSIVEEFKKDNPEYDVKVDYKEDFSDFGTKIKLGEKYNHVDLYFGTIPDPSYNRDYLEPLNSVLTEVNTGETKKVGEKIDSYLLDNAKYWDDNYYSLPYGGGICGIVYNNKLMQEVLADHPDLKINTTKELERLVDYIDEKYGQDRKAFIHFKGGYWNYVQDVWQAQYDGLEEYENFYRLGAAADTIGKENETPNKDVLLRDDGRQKVLEVLDNLLYKGTNVVSGSNTMEHTDAQTKFLNGQAVMMCNGAWLVNEMKGVGATYTDFRVMRTPVISTITEKLEKNMGDPTLSAIIDKIDAGKEYSDPEVSVLCSENDYNRIKQARSLIWQVFSEHGACIPNYATAKEGAKLFVKYYFSDKAQKIFNDTVHIALPFTYDKAENEPDTSSWTNFEKDMYDYANSLTMLGVANGKRSSLFTMGNLMNYPAIGSDSIIKLISQYDSPMHSGDVWKEIKKLYEKDWSTYLSNARLA